ncbi:MAG: VanZ family protein [Clostridia bacterium]|nr:VanZ family protein [Clostridia bacterium]
MLNGKKLRIARYILWTLLLAMLVIIFLFSAQKGEDSGETSGYIAQMVLRIIRPDYTFLPEETQQALLERTDWIVRKGAHFSEYAVLAFILYFLLRTYPLKIYAAWAWLGATGYAVTDEVHQLFVGERAGSMKDVLLDSCGAAAGVALAYLLAKWKLKKGKKV